MVSGKEVYLIKDLAHLSELSIHTIKYYLKLKLIAETGRSPGTSYRYFDNSTLETLKRIIQYRREGLSLGKIGYPLKNEEHTE